MAESARLHVALQEGFDGDRVVVTVGDSRYEFATLSTRNQIGLADEVEVEIPLGPIDVRVALPDRSLDTGAEYALRTETWIGVNLASGDLEFTWSDVPFFYA